MPPILLFVRILRADAHHPVRKRLWQAGLGLALFIGVFVIHEVAVRSADPARRLSMGGDFVPVYAAAKLIRANKGEGLYSLPMMERMERQVVAEADLEPLPVYGAFLNPPFFAALFVPLTRVPYRTAAGLWLAINLTLLIGAIVLLCRLLPRDAGWKNWALVPLLIVLPLPFWQAMCHQQNTVLSLMLLTIIVSLWRESRARCDQACLQSRAGPSSGRPGRALNRAEDGPAPVGGETVANHHAILAGAVTGLLFYKPQLALVIALVLVLSLGWRALLGLSIAGAALLGFTLTALPGSLTSYLHALPATVSWLQDRSAYNWGRQVTPQSFWRLLLQGSHVAGPTHALPRAMALLTMAGAGASLAAAVSRLVRRKQDAASLDRTIAAAVSAMPLLMPYYMDYDLLLLAVPAVLLAGEWMRSTGPKTRLDRFLLTSWIVLFLAMYPHGLFSGQLRLNFAVPLIAWVAGLSILRCLRPPVASGGGERYDVNSTAALAA